MLREFRKKKLEKFKNIIGISLVIVFVIPLIIIFSPFIIIIGIYNSLNDKVFEKAYKEYLNSINGTFFFCYNNRKNSQKFIEEKLLPVLSKDVKLIFLNGKKVESNFEQKYMSKALYSIKDRKGFPYLLKVSNGTIIDKSINKEFYNIKNQNRELENLINILNEFYK